jgi:hypothetical protein
MQRKTCMSFDGEFGRITVDHHSLEQKTTVYVWMSSEFTKIIFCWKLQSVVLPKLQWFTIILLISPQIQTCTTKSHCHNDFVKVTANPKIHQVTTLIMKWIYDNPSKRIWFWTFTIEINATGWHESHGYSKNIPIQIILNSLLNLRIFMTSKVQQLNISVAWQLQKIIHPKRSYHRCWLMTMKTSGLSNQNLHQNNYLLWSKSIMQIKNDKSNEKRFRKYKHHNLQLKWREQISSIEQYKHINSNLKIETQQPQDQNMNLVKKSRS